MTFKEKILKCEAVFGTHIQLSDSIASEILASLGYDFLWIDMEHTTLSPEQVRTHMLACSSGGAASLVRVPVHDLTMTKRILEMGPDGIIFPMIHNYDEALELISWTLYPPDGVRGCGPKRAIRYGLDNEFEYYKYGSKNMCRFIQIETKTAVDDIEKLATIPYLDGFIMGMYDLSGSINRLGDVFGKENLELAERVIKVAKATGKTVGISLGATDEKTIQRVLDMGFNFISLGADHDYILRCGIETLERINKIQKGSK